MRRFTIIIIGESGKDYYYYKNIESGDSISVDHKEKTYAGEVSDSWFKKYGPLGRFFKGSTGMNLLVFHEIKDEEEAKPIVRGSSAKTSSHMLMMAHRYKGVNPALKDQFMEKSAMDLPLWAMVVGVIVFIALVVGIGIKQGWLLTMIQKKPEVKAELTFILSETLRRIRS